jgi:hypothetical protein
MSARRKLHPYSGASKAYWRGSGVGNEPAGRRSYTRQPSEERWPALDDDRLSGLQVANRYVDIGIANLEMLCGFDRRLLNVPAGAGLAVDRNFVARARDLQFRGPLSSMPVRNPVRDMSGRWSLSLGLHTSHGIPPPAVTGVGPRAEHARGAVRIRHHHPERRPARLRLSRASRSSTRRRGGGGMAHPREEARRKQCQASPEVAVQR